MMFYWLRVSGTQHKELLESLVQNTDVTSLLEQDYGGKCAFDYIDKKDIVHLIELSVLKKPAKAINLSILENGARVKRDRKVKLETRKAMIVVASINALLIFLIDRIVQRTPGEIPANTQSLNTNEIKTELESLRLIDGFNSIRQDFEHFDNFLTNVITNETWLNYAQTLIVGDENYDCFIKKEFDLFQLRLDIYMSTYR